MTQERELRQQAQRVCEQSLAAAAERLAAASVPSDIFDAVDLRRHLLMPVPCTPGSPKIFDVVDLLRPSSQHLVWLSTPEGKAAFKDAVSQVVSP